MLSSSMSDNDERVRSIVAFYSDPVAVIASRFRALIGSKRILGQHW